MKTILMLKLTCATLLLATLLPAFARQPLPVTHQDAQLISYFRSYAPAAEVMIKKTESGMQTNGDVSVDKNGIPRKASVTGNPADGDKQSSRMNEANQRDDRLVMPPSPQLPQ